MVFSGIAEVSLVLKAARRVFNVKRVRFGIDLRGLSPLIISPVITRKYFDCLQLWRPSACVCVRLHASEGVPKCASHSLSEDFFLGLVIQL